MSALTYGSTIAFLALLAFAFHRSWLCSNDYSRPAAVAVAPAASQPAVAVPKSTFALDAANPLAQPGPLRPQDPTDPASFSPLPPVRRI